MINNEILEAVQLTLSKQFGNGLKSVADTDVSAFTTDVKASSKTVRFDWLGDFPQIRKWVGPRLTRKLKSYKYEVSWEDFERTLEVERNDIEDDIGSIGVYGLQAFAVGQEASFLKPRLVSNALVNGTTELCYDGQYFFDTDHAVGLDGDTSTFSNNITSGSVGSNSSSASPWYLIDSTKAIKPIIYITRRSFKMQSFASMDNLHTFMTRQFLYGMDGSFGTGYGLWQTALRCTNLLCVENLRDMRSTMRLYTGDHKNEDGDRLELGINPDTLVVGKGNEDRARLLLQSANVGTYTGDVLSPGATDTPKPNYMLNQFKLVVDRWLP